MLKPMGRVPSLLAWGLLVGGVALLMTLPAGGPVDSVGARHLPAAFLFTLAGLVFGLSHPEDRVWTGALILGWVPPVATLFVAVNGSTLSPGPWLALVVLPAALAGAGGWGGAVLARRRARSP